MNDNLPLATLELLWPDIRMAIASVIDFCWVPALENFLDRSDELSGAAVFDDVMLLAILVDHSTLSPVEIFLERPVSQDQEPDAWVRNGGPEGPRNRAWGATWPPAVCRAAERAAERIIEHLWAEEIRDFSSLGAGASCGHVFLSLAVLAAYVRHARQHTRGGDRPRGENQHALATPSTSQTTRG